MCSRILVRVSAIVPRARPRKNKFIVAAATIGSKIVAFATIFKNCYNFRVAAATKKTAIQGTPGFPRSPISIDNFVKSNFKKGPQTVSYGERDSK